MKTRIYIFLTISLFICCSKLNEGNDKESLEARASANSDVTYPGPSMFNDGVLTSSEVSAFIVETRNYILINYGEDLYLTFSRNDPGIATIGLLIKALELKANQGYMLSSGQQTLRITSSIALGTPRGGSIYCAGEALGMGLVYEAIGTRTLKAAVKLGVKALSKQVLKGLPIVGWILGAYDFGDCMGWT